MPEDFSNMGAGGGMGAETPAPTGDMPPEKGAPQTVMLSADHFPEGMVPKEGDKLTFMVTAAPDSEGNVAGYFEPMGMKGDGKDAWAEDFKKEMSPQNGEEMPA